MGLYPSRNQLRQTSLAVSVAVLHARGFGSYFFGHSWICTHPGRLHSETNHADDAVIIIARQTKWAGGQYSGRLSFETKRNALKSTNSVNLTLAGVPVSPSWHLGHPRLELARTLRSDTPHCRPGPSEG